MNYLIIAAHPDDEVLGAGGTIHKLTAEGHTVSVCVMSTDVKARANRPEDDALLGDMKSAMGDLGIRTIIQGGFPNIEMNTVPHLHLVQFIENAILETEAEVLITHHPSDTNDDHHQTARACGAALRIFQRRADVKPIRELWYMEVPSSTEWAVDSSLGSFRPNTYVEIGAEGVERKLAALAMYRSVMRPYPHPRSKEAIEGLAAFRGSQAGCCYAEGFECIFRRY